MNKTLSTIIIGLVLSCLVSCGSSREKALAEHIRQVENELKTDAPPFRP